MLTAHKAAQAIGVIIVLGLVTKVLGFLRESVLANYYGTLPGMDAYNIALSVPGILLAGLGASFATTFIPAFTRSLHARGKDATFAMCNTLFTAFALIAMAICCLGAVFAPWIARCLAPSFTREKILLTAGLSRILLLTGAFNVVNGCLIGLLHGQEFFTIPAAIGLPVNLTIIIMVAVFAERYGIFALAYGTALAAVAQFLFEIPAVVRTGYRYRPALQSSDPEVKRVSQLVLPVFLGTMLLQVNTMVDRIFASGLPEGSISALGYAGKLNGLVISLVVTAVGTVSLPAFSQAVAISDMGRLRANMLNALRATNLLVIPLCVGLITLREPIVRLAFERGAFDARATSMTTTVILFLSPGLVVYGLRDIFTRAFYALQDTTTPMVNAAVVIMLNLVFLKLLVPRFGLAGLASATSLSGFCAGALLLVTLRRKIGHVGGGEMLRSTGRILVASAIMGLLVHKLRPLLEGLAARHGFGGQVLSLAGLAAIGGLLFLSVLFGMRAPEIKLVLNLLSRTRSGSPFISGRQE